MNAVIELEEAYNHYKDDPEFNRELTELLNEYAGRPSRLYYAAVSYTHLSSLEKSQFWVCVWDIRASAKPLAEWFPMQKN